MDLMIFKKINNPKNIFCLSIAIIILFLISFFDKGLAVGFGLLIILSVITFFVLKKNGINDKKIIFLFSIVLVIHISATLFMHYANFQPFSGGQGDYLVYQSSAITMSQCLSQGNFSIKNMVMKNPDLFVANCYPLIVGSLYSLTMPEEIIGLIFNVWLVAISIIIVYLIVLEIGGSWKSAFLVGLMALIYPSYLFMTSLLLKEAIEIFFVLLGLLFIIKTIKKFNWKNFLVLYLALICATHFRFYIGYALIATFVLSWFLFSNVEIRKRLIYGVIFIVLLGFVPQIAADQGYCGMDSFRTYLNLHMVNFYRQVVYVAEPSTNTAEPSIVGLDSSFVGEGNLLGYIKSFVCVLLGPLPWQIKNIHQSFVLAETIPWYILLFFIVDGIIIAFRKKIKEVAPLLIFSVMVMIVMTIFNSNLGIIVRIRIPAFISLLCIASLSFNNMKFIDGIFSKLESIFNKSIGKLASL